MVCSCPCGLEILTDFQLELKLDLITATAAISGLSSILFGITTNLPVALA